MLSFSTIIIGAFLSIAVWFWWTTFNAREHAQRLAQKLCQHDNVQLLDGTVALKKIAFPKNKRGDRQLVRYFGFEFSTTRIDRCEGTIVLCGFETHYVHMDLPDKPTLTIEPEATSKTETTEQKE